MAISVNEYEKALTALKEALDKLKITTNEVDYKITRDACIQRFEFCVELAWKVAQKTLGSSSTTAKPVIREMAQNKLIKSPEPWFQFIEARNKSSHTYDEQVAREVLSVIDAFVPEAELLLKVMSQK